MQIHYDATQKSRGKHGICELGRRAFRGRRWGFLFLVATHTQRILPFWVQHLGAPRITWVRSLTWRCPDCLDWSAKTHADCEWHLLLVAQIKGVQQRDDHHLACLTFPPARVNLPCAPAVPLTTSLLPVPVSMFSLKSRDQWLSRTPPGFWCQIGTAEAPGLLGWTTPDVAFLCQWESRTEERQVS